ncbi:LysM peptidoglycan-binding domain-containing protein [Cystobacter fuscus]|uniref:LysM peptidoglycan-binding domain-containing protein n=1 Tax=Cystobacter fuscus TaxID=43 RepID=UPI002B2E4085|nr:LysM peptidoglycan-binding domain-containing protein [Cystobacter fuscus]
MNAHLEKFLAVARSQVGYRSSRMPNGLPRTKYGAWYGLQHQYCAMFVSWCAAKSGNGAAFRKRALVQALIDDFRRKRRFGAKPRVGALVCFDWRPGRPGGNHVGIVVQVKKDHIVTIEGNTGKPNGVHQRIRKASITGYCYPPFTDRARPPPKKPLPGAPVPKPAASLTYTTKPGDTLSAISNRFKVPGGWKELARVNRISNPSLLQVGVKLVIPGGRAPPAPAKRAVQIWRTVAPGDNLLTLSKRFGVPVTTLLARNKGRPGQGEIKNPSLLVVGQRIRIK